MRIIVESTTGSLTMLGRIIGSAALLLGVFALDAIAPARDGISRLGPGCPDPRVASKLRWIRDVRSGGWRFVVLAWRSIDPDRLAPTGRAQLDIRRARDCARAFMDGERRLHRRDCCARRGQIDSAWHFVDGIVNVVLGLAIALQWPVSGIVSIGLFVGLRYMSAGWSLLVRPPRSPLTAASETGDMHPDASLGLAPHRYIGAIQSTLASEEKVRRHNDAAWCWLFLMTFFVIHASRMDVDMNLIGLLSPVGAVVGDVFIAVLVAYGLIAPLSLSVRRLTRRVERRAWNRHLASVDSGTNTGFASATVRWWLVCACAAAQRRSQARGSPTAAMGWGLRTGLPAAAILMALTPLWGVNWIFDTETWVTGAWQAWADQRTETWRVEMVRAVRKAYGPAGIEPEFLRVAPEGLAGAKDFSFVVIGDTGEGDASQHILRDQLLLVGQKPEVKFLIVSSDVIYPSGAMKDYEPKFFLPFKGFNKPIYALPGNHDWYDALESFTANFFEPTAARTAMRADARPTFD